MRLIVKYFIYLFLLFFPAMVFSQMKDPVHFEILQKKQSPSEIILIFQGKIESGWHVYSTDIKEGGPIAASLHIESQEGVSLSGKLVAKGDIKEKYDNLFSMKVSYMENSAVFQQTLRITKKHYSISGYLEYGACSDENCLPPTQVPFSIKGTDGSEVTAEKVEVKDTVSPITKEPLAVEDTASVSLPEYWLPASQQARNLEESTRDASLWWIFLMGIIGGLIAVVTPCVWPIIPMTISYFLKKTEKYNKGLRNALLYGLSIIIVYVSLGIFITLIYGSNGLNTLSTSAVFNIVCFIVLVVFSASFLGGFEITLPSSKVKEANLESLKNT